MKGNAVAGNICFRIQLLVLYWFSLSSDAKISFLGVIACLYFTLQIKIIFWLKNPLGYIYFTLHVKLLSLSHLRISLILLLKLV